MSSEGSGSGGRTLPVELEEALKLGPFHRALGLAIADSGLALSRLEYRLERRGIHVGRSTLSYWQQGRRRPERPDSLQALAALEEILELPQNSLSRLLGPRKPRGRWIGHRVGGVSLTDMWVEYADVQRLVAMDSRRIADRLHDISLVERMTIGVDRRLQSLRVDIVTQGRTAGADRALFVYNPDPDVDVSRLAMTDLTNCRTGRQRAAPEESLYANELLFDRALGVDDTHVFGYTLDLRSSYYSADELSGRRAVPNEAVDGGRAFRRLTHAYVLQARFSPQARPVRIYHIEAARIGGSARVVSELLLDAHNTTHIALQNVLPGVHGIRWEWE